VTLEDHQEDEPQILNKVVAILTAVYSGQEEIAQELFNEIVGKEEFYATLVNLLLSSYTMISRASGIPVEDYLQRLGYLSTIF
jgi:carbon starvation protein CstA